MNKIQEIFKAWNISFNPDEEQAKIASKRIEICNSCEYKVTNLNINRCSVCGCALKAKVFSPVKGACPKGKWDAVDGKQEVEPVHDMIREIEDAITDADCEALIEQAKSKLVKAEVLGVQVDNYMTAQNTWLNELNDATFKIKTVVESYTGLPMQHQEQVHIVKYDVGGEYKSHHDFFHENTDYYDAVMERGGQRVYSCLFYLNDDFEGGETYFNKVKYTVKPKKRKLVVWNNLNEDGTPNKNSMHAGLPVTKGEKWICIVWVREKRI